MSYSTQDELNPGLAHVRLVTVPSNSLDIYNLLVDNQHTFADYPPEKPRQTQHPIVFTTERLGGMSVSQ